MASARYIKLGLLTLFVGGAIVVTAIVLGLRAPPRDLYTTYFDESVQGLETGAPIKYRGIAVGRVEEIEVAPDGRLVAVRMAIRSAFAEKVELPRIAAKLRAQLVMQNISGVKLVELDWPVPGTAPPPELAFAPPARYIPSRPSTLADIERRVRGQAPEFFERVSRTIDRVDALLADIRAERLPARFGAAADAATATFRSLSRTGAKADRVLDRVGGKRGLVASAARAANTLDNVGAGVLESVGELERALRSIDEAARALRELLLLLEREPDALVKGRKRSKRS